MYILKKMDSEMREYLDANFARIDERFAEMESKFKADLERIETKLLTEFHKWASPAEMRAKSHALALQAMDLEMGSLADRVSKLEGGRP
jgi:hypothetical protein